MIYRDANGIEHEDSNAACRYYGADTPDDVAAEMKDRDERGCIEAQDEMEARGGPEFYVSLAMMYAGIF